MKTKHGLLLLLSIALLWTSCKKDDKLTKDNRTIFQYEQPIVNPPDTFAIEFKFNSHDEKTARIYFEEEGEWQIVKEGDTRYSLNFADKNGVHPIQSSALFNVFPEFEYQVVVSNMSSLENMNCSVGFNKKQIEVESLTKIH